MAGDREPKEPRVAELERDQAHARGPFERVDLRAAREMRAQPLLVAGERHRRDVQPLGGQERRSATQGIMPPPGAPESGSPML